jgi:RecA-family ATPase
LRDVGLVIIDPISAYLGDTDSHNNTDVRARLSPLAELAERYRVAIVCISHTNKSAGSSAIYRTSGSTAFVAAA